MACYVDPVARTPRTNKWRYVTSCHLICDTADELDAIAEKIGLKPEWKQNPLTAQEHYDLTESRRAEAIGFGAKKVKTSQFACIMQRKIKRGYQ